MAGMRSPIRVVLALAPALIGAAFGQNEAADDKVEPARASETARLVSAEQALSGARIATLNPGTLNGAEIRTVLGDGPVCLFRYTSSGRPVLAFPPPTSGGATRALIKLNGNLLALNARPEGGSGSSGTLAFAAERFQIEVGAPPGALTDGSLREADMVFSVGQDLRVGYGGYLGCAPNPPRGGRVR